MKITNKWQLIHMNLGTTLTNIHLTLLNGYMPQISTLDIPKSIIPFDGVVFTRQAVIKRKKLKESKGHDMNISMNHKFLVNTQLTDELLISFAKIISKIKNKTGDNQNGQN